MSLHNVADVLARLDLSLLEAEPPLILQVGHLRLGLRCTAPMASYLAQYFADCLCDAGPNGAPHDGPLDARIDILEGQALTPAPDWIDWAREPGKTGRKDAFIDLDDGRLIYKQRTGVTFLQSPQALIAFGPGLANPSQIVNFINTQILNICQRDGWQMCHAAAVTNGRRSLAISGLSGGGKSTSILRMLNLPGTAFVSNDRLLVQARTPVPQALGIPKQPRINPGTILHNPRLHSLLSADRLQALSAMPRDALWELEEKHDLMVSDIYGPGRINYHAPLTDFWVLNWQHDSDQPTQVSQVDLATRPDLLSAIMKSPGPFYQQADGAFAANGAPLDTQAYLAALAGATISEVSGRIDFEVLQQEGSAIFGAQAQAQG